MTTQVKRELAQVTVDKLYLSLGGVLHELCFGQTTLDQLRSSLMCSSVSEFALLSELKGHWPAVAIKAMCEARDDGRLLFDSVGGSIAFEDVSRFLGKWKLPPISGPHNDTCLLDNIPMLVGVPSPAQFPIPIVWAACPYPPKKPADRPAPQEESVDDMAGGGWKDSQDEEEADR